MADAFDAMEKMAIAAQIQASWYGWPIDENGPCLGYQPWLPVIPWSGWRVQFMQDAPRRALILAQAAVLLEAQELLRR
jgi:hypothetical protein